jgi:hypothetical protein
MNPFTFGCQDIHNLNILSDQKKFIVIVGGEIFKYTLEQLAFLSPLIFSHFLTTDEPYQIEVPIVDSICFLNCFKEIDSLFYSVSELLIPSQKVEYLFKIAELLGNPHLLETCKSPCQNDFLQFSFNSAHLAFLNIEQKKALINFTLIINNTSFHINKNMFSCVSELLLGVDSFQNSLSFSVSNEVFECFTSFIKILEGFSFFGNNFPISTIVSMTDTFLFKSLKEFVDSFLKSCNNIEDSIRFLSQNGFSSFENIFQQSVSVLADNFSSLTFEQLNILSIEVLQAIIKSDKIKNPNEDYIQQIILKKIPKIKISLSNSSKIKLFQHLEELDTFEHWIFVSSEFDFVSFKLEFDPIKTAFIIIENAVEEVYRTSQCYKNQKLKSVSMIYSFKIFGNNAFYNFSQLQSISLPDTLISLGDRCFSGCSSLQSISLPSTLVSLDNYCFSFCSSLQSIVLSNALTSLGNNCFSHCSSLHSISLPKSLFFAGSYVFSGCNSL